jgi:hypothetical protein
MFSSTNEIVQRIRILSDEYGWLISSKAILRATTESRPYSRAPSKSLNPIKKPRISKSETNSNDQNSNDQNEKNPKASYHAAFVLDFEHLNFGFVSDFVLRASNLGRL